VADLVELTELDVIARYSLAVSPLAVDRTELIGVLREDIAWLESLEDDADTSDDSTS
jgi:hypothetical protein